MRIRFRTYFLKQALQNIRENLWVHALGLGTMTSSLLIFGMFMLLFANVANCIHGWGNSVSFSVYLKDDISPYKRDKVDSFLRQLPGEKMLRYISKKDAMADLKKTLGRSDAGLLNRLSGNPLPASYEVFFDRTKKQALDSGAITADLANLAGVAEVQCSEELLNNVKEIIDMVKFIGYFVGGLLCFCVIFIMTNTIKLTIFYRKAEIEILKLVGATDWFIKVPFLLEGIFQGILAGVLTLLMLGGGYLFFATKEIQFFGMNSLNLVFISFGHMTLLFSISVTLGMIGSLMAIGRFFKV
ncbi:MAG: ABC transporter permease [Deltaproteobacteria bacterium]|nr:ABC transporter permease [Deltaproteobacteria bacterium]